jgi:hypothetical protein
MTTRYKFLLCFLLLCCTSYTSMANGNCDFNECRVAKCCHGNWELDAEFIYFLPTFDDTYYVIQYPSLTADTGERLNNDFNFCPGFRVGGAFVTDSCCGKLQGYYTRLSHNQTENIEGALAGTVGRPTLLVNFGRYQGFATSSLDFLYQRIDSYYSRQLWHNCRMYLESRIGLEYGYVRLKESYEYRFATLNVGGLVDQQSKSWGIGPQLGLKYDYLLCQISSWLPGVLSLSGQTSGSLLVSKTEMEALNTFLVGGEVPNVLLDINDEHTWRIIPSFHARIGLNYSMDFSCWDAYIEAGYEFSSYFRALTRYIFPAEGVAGLCLTQYYNFDVQGLYIAGSITF